MIQNLKVDVIYHLTQSDFEMEFNLCGCCRMRLLNDKTTDKKSFVRALARDVARSRVIIACGPLFGTDGTIATVATAIGNGLALCDNKTYGIKGDDEINIINGSTPLVTPDGYFGGCIIESGPQTIILLTENKAFRKSILQTLIHPYIEEISYIPSKTTPIEPAPQEEPSEFETAVAETETYISEVEEYESEAQVEEADALPAVQDEHNIEFVMDGESEEKDDADVETVDSVSNNNDILMYTEIETQAELKSRYSEPYKPSENDKMFILEPEEDMQKIDCKAEKKEKSMNITIVLLVMLLSIALLAVLYLLVIRPVTTGADVGQYIKEIFGMASNTNSLV